MKEAFDKIFGGIARSIDIHSRVEGWAKAIFFAIFLWPTSGYVWQHKDKLDTLLSHVGMSPGMVGTVLWVVCALLFGGLIIKLIDLHLSRLPAATAASNTAPSAASPALAPSKNTKVDAVAPFDFKPKTLRFKRDEEPYVQIGDMVFTEKDLYTSCLITGVTGTGKTSAAVFPMLEQIFSIYNETNDGDYGSAGGLCLDVKGEFFEGIIYYMHRAGRNVFDDIQVIRPNCLMPVVRFKDPSTGYFFYLNAKACSSGAESWDLIRGKKFKDGTDIPLNVFTFSKRKLELLEPKLKEMVFDVAGQKMNYLGWRFQGDRMVRVSHTPAFNETHVLLKDGQRQVIDAPRSLVYEGVTFIDNMLRYNIVEPNKPAPEAAMRLNLISTLAEGEKQTGENAYWYKRARAHIGSCIELWRLAYDDNPQCTAQAIYKITQQDDYAKKQVKLVETKIKGMQEQLVGLTDFGDRVGLEREIERMTSIVKYFTEEWGKYDTKTKTIVGSVVANAFDTFNKDPVLQDSFCQPKTFSFEQCIQEGKIFVLVAGDEYETVAKILGTALKMDFQSTILSRIHRSELNQKRKIMLVNDECQKFVVAGGSQGAGDEHFMSLCRQSKCFNINATQADSWIISVVGKENSDVYLQNYNGRIWFRTNDKETAEKAEQLCGIKKQKTRSAGSQKTIHLENLFLGPKGSADHSPQFSEKEEEKPRFQKDKFYNLEKWEAIIFNGTRTGSDKACQSQCEPAYVGSPEGQRDVRDVMRIYFQGYLENLAYRQNGGKMFDPVPEAKPVAAAAAAPIDVSAQATNTPVATPAAAPAAGTPVVPAPAPAAPLAPLPPAELKDFGDTEALKARANKLLKSVQVVAPRVANPTEGTQPPFQAPVAENSNAPATIPIVGKDFSPAQVTPNQLQATMQTYQNGTAESVNETLKDAHFIPPVNPTEYLPMKKEEESGRTPDPALAGERAAMGPQGLQGGNPNFAMMNGSPIEIPKPAVDAFEQAREQALKEEKSAHARTFVQAINAQEGPKPDIDTLELLKNLKPETEDKK